MMHVGEEMQHVFDKLRTQREELRVQLHLARAEARDAWVDLERTWEHARGKLRVLGSEAGDAARDVKFALKLAAEELERGYERVRRLM